MKPLKLSIKNWRSRWLVFQDFRLLHRVSKISWRDGEKICGNGSSVCGRKGFMHMPGVFSRMALKRCQKCCKILDMPPGIGAPLNEFKIGKWSRK